MMDKSSFEIIILPLYKRIYITCLAIIGDRNEAADAVQETFVTLWERREELDRVGACEPYVRTVARNVCLRRLQFRARHGTLEELSNAESGINHTAEISSELAYLRSLIESLPAPQRRVMILSVFGSCSNAEIAQIMGESPENVRQLLSRARKKIKELYNKRNQKS